MVALAGPKQVSAGVTLFKRYCQVNSADAAKLPTNRGVHAAAVAAAHV
jgi:hypothetical protein